MNSILLPVFVFFLVFSSCMAFGAGAQECGVDVYGLDVQKNEIFANIKNTGWEPENITYSVYVNDKQVFSGNLALDVTETVRTGISYSFNYGEYVIKIVASAGCGYQDSETVSHVILQDYSCFSPHGLEGQDYCDYYSQRYYICQDGKWVEAEGYSYHCALDCQEGYLSSYRCYGNVLQAEYQHSDCSTEWVNSQYCRYGCESGQCLPRFSCTPHYQTACYNGDLWWYDSCNRRESVHEYCEAGCINDRCIREYCSSGWVCTDGYHRAYRHYDCTFSYSTYCQYGCEDGMCRPETICGVDITSFDYVEHAREDYQTYVTATVLNTGNDDETIELTLYVDGVKRGHYSKSLDPRESYIKTLYYFPDAGTNSVKVTARAGCGSVDTRSATVYAHDTKDSAICNSNGLCEPSLGENQGTCPSDCKPAEPVKTWVGFYPESMDTILNKGNAVVINIRSSRPQAFSIDVKGVPSDWLSYSGGVDVDREEAVYVYIIPKSLGSYDVDVTVTALSENLRFSSDIDLYVASEKIEGSFAGGPTISGEAIDNALTDFWVVLSIIIIAIAVVVVFGGIRLRKKAAIRKQEEEEEKAEVEKGKT
jgi:hypothetical protein